MAAAQLPIPTTPPTARSPGQGSWDPGWPPASAQGSPSVKRLRPIGAPTLGVAVSAEELHRILTRLVEGATDNAGRLDILERETKMVGDALGTVGRHCQASSAELRGHLASSNADLGKAMQAVDAALRATIEAAQDRFAEFQRDAKELMSRTDQGVIQLNFKAQEHERVMTDMWPSWKPNSSSKCR